MKLSKAFKNGDWDAAKKYAESGFLTGEIEILVVGEADGVSRIRERQKGKKKPARSASAAMAEAAVA